EVMNEQKTVSPEPHKAVSKASEPDPLDKPRYHYQGLDEDTRRSLLTYATRIRSHMITAVDSVLEIGHWLRKAKERLEHGQWLPWLEAEFAMSERMAQHLMNVHEQFRHRKIKMGNMAPKALYVLAAPSVPEAARAEASARANAGEKISPKEARKIVK